MDKFQAVDKAGQDKVLANLDLFLSGCTLTVDQHWRDKKEVDILLTATTSNGVETYYAIECKDRTYADYIFTDWVIEQNKITALTEASKAGYIPLYINTFTNNIMLIWDLNTAPMIDRRIYAGKTTLVDKGKVVKNNKALKTTDAVWRGKMK